MPDPRDHSPPQRPLTDEDAVLLAERMAMLATPSRLRILYALLAGERSVEELAQAAGLPANTVSQQLRMLRSTRLMRVRREGRRAIYALHDPHVADLLAAVRHHSEHAAHGWAERVRAGELDDVTR
jgi:ArsR family transcriptional regulator, nickel/cobalt-responsive transcriptional repressor